MDSIDSAKKKIRLIIAGSRVPEDLLHADNTLEWLLRLDPEADDALQIAALAHDIDRAIEEIKVKRKDFDDYDCPSRKLVALEILDHFPLSVQTRQGIIFLLGDWT